MNYSESDLDRLFDWADLIYVGGGDTNHMMKIWKKLGIHTRLAEIYEKDLAVLTGISAGAVCWFEFGHSDSESLLQGDEQFAWVEDLLGVYRGGFCPHYNDRGRESFDIMLEERASKLKKHLCGYALENNTAFVEDKGDIFFLHTNEEDKGYFFEVEDKMVHKNKVEMQTL